jgi:hypothetical protein
MGSDNLGVGLSLSFLSMSFRLSDVEGEYDPRASHRAAVAANGSYFLQGFPNNGKMMEYWVPCIARSSPERSVAQPIDFRDGFLQQLPPVPSRGGPHRRST